MLKKIIVASILLFPALSSAFSPTFSVPDDQFHVFPLPENIEMKREYYGELTGFPHLYEVTLSEPQALQLEVYTPVSNPTKDFSGIVVEVIKKTGRVAEVKRFGYGENPWQPVGQDYTGETLLRGPFVEAELTPGTYRIEVNTPLNEGMYVMVMGAKPQGSGYFELIANVWDVKDFYGHSYLSMYFISPIAAPIGIVLLLVLMFYTWRYYRRMKGVALTDSEFAE